MAKERFSAFALVVILIVLVLIIVLIMIPNSSDGSFDSTKCPAGSIFDKNSQSCIGLEKIFCEPPQRNAEVCIEIFEPVCGWFDTTRVKCTSFPCAQEFSNSCFACSNSDVLFYTFGKCPTN